MESPLFKLQPGDLDKFVKDNLEPDSAYNASCSAVVDRLCSFMQNSFPIDLRPSSIIKSGSLGKGTAVKGKSDADLVLFLANSKYNSIEKIKSNMDDILAQMEASLRAYGQFSVEGKTSHAVKISVSCHNGHTHDVDILPSFNILYGNKPNDIYICLMRENSWFSKSFYSAALAPLQLKFIRAMPTKVKMLIRLVKFWRKTSFVESSAAQRKRLPNSYLLELITISKWENDGSSDFDLRKGFFYVLKALENYHQFEIIWSVNYTASDLRRYRIQLNRPYILDPANPFNNVMEACDCWDEVQQVARKTLEKPLFRGCMKD